jgi:thioredoxin reductase (NADPH)
VTLLHRRADLAETMSDYLIHDLERAGVLVRGRSEIAALRGADDQLEAATLRDGERIPLSFLLRFLGAAPHTKWPGGRCRGHPRDERARRLRAGDVRSGSVKRCATAVGEGAKVVRLVHERFSTDLVGARAASGS